jgi:GAF domain-containing protein
MSPGHVGFVPAPPHPREAARLAALKEYGVLDTPPEVAFDDIVFLASHICRTPMALVSLVDESRQWFKAKVGTELQETSREVAFCAHAILEPGEMLVVPDAREDPRFATNPMVTGEPKVRFYAGAPLNSPEGLPLGTLCTFDLVPRRLTPEQARAMAALSREVMVHLEMRRTIARLQEALDGGGPWPSGGLEAEMETGLEEAGRTAARASALVSEAMETVLEAEERMRNLVYRLQDVQSRVPPRPPASEP